VSKGLSRALKPYDMTLSGTQKMSKKEEQHHRLPWNVVSIIVAYNQKKLNYGNGFTDLMWNEL
jgi:hypothetical protein